MAAVGLACREPRVRTVSKRCCAKCSLVRFADGQCPVRPSWALPQHRTQLVCRGRKREYEPQTSSRHGPCRQGPPTPVVLTSIPRLTDHPGDLMRIKLGRLSEYVIHCVVFPSLFVVNNDVPLGNSPGLICPGMPGCWCCAAGSLPAAAGPCRPKTCVTWPDPRSHRARGPVLGSAAGQEPAGSAAAGVSCRWRPAGRGPPRATCFLVAKPAGCRTRGASRTRSRRR